MSAGSGFEEKKGDDARFSSQPLGDICIQVPCAHILLLQSQHEE